MEYKVYKGKYEVYEDGRVYSVKHARYLKPYIQKGYSKVSLFIDGKCERWLVHRLVAVLFIGEAPKGRPDINHIDGNKQNNHYTNLEWCDRAYNNKHARAFGLNDISSSNHRRWEDATFRAKTSSNMSKAAKGKRTGVKNPRFRYLIMRGTSPISRQDLCVLLGLSQSRTDTLIREAAQDKPTILARHGISVVDTKGSQSTIESIAAGKAGCEEASRVAHQCNSGVPSAKCLCVGNRYTDSDIVSTQ